MYGYDVFAAVVCCFDLAAGGWGLRSAGVVQRQQQDPPQPPDAAAAAAAAAADGKEGGKLSLTHYQHIY